ncbi:MAG: DoxX family protein [Saonia sp.]
MITLWNKIRNTALSFEKISLGLLVYRILLSLSLINTHGLKKILHFDDSVAHIPDPFGLGGEFNTYFAVFANIFCALLVAFGCFTRLAIIPIISITLSGFFIVHFSDPWPIKDVPLMYSLAFLLLLYVGPGKYSLDHRLFNKKR